MTTPTEEGGQASKNGGPDSGPWTVQTSPPQPGWIPLDVKGRFLRAMISIVRHAA